MDGCQKRLEAEGLMLANSTAFTLTLRGPNISWYFAN